MARQPSPPSSLRNSRPLTRAQTRGGSDASSATASTRPVGRRPLGAPVTTCIEASPQLPPAITWTISGGPGLITHGIGVLFGQPLIDRNPGRAPVIAAIHALPAREVDACRHGASGHRARRCRPSRSRDDTPPLLVAQKDRRGPRDERALAIRIVSDSEGGTDQDVRGFDLPVAPAVARRHNTAVGRQEEVVGLGGADGERDGPADEAAGVDREPGRPAVAGSKEPAPRARIVRERRAGPQRETQGEEQGLAPHVAPQIAQRQGSDDVALVSAGPRAGPESHKPWRIQARRAATLRDNGMWWHRGIDAQRPVRAARNVGRLAVRQDELGSTRATPVGNVPPVGRDGVSG